MRALVISDIHSNIEALQTVLADADRQGGYDAVWCTGDIVGYGPDPIAVVRELEALGAVCVCGNHDLASCGLMDTREFNRAAADAVEWTSRALDGRARGMLESLPKVCTVGDVTLVHGSLREPEWEYLLEPEQAEAQFALQTTPISIVGHSHLPFLCGERSDGEGPPRFHATSDGEHLALDGSRIILNPGSVGQPRDGDPRASYLLLDLGAGGVSWHRVAYDHEETRRKIAAAGLPEILGARLALGR